ncbi:MAG: paraquat-inducible protein A [Gammaproteobacteria bacterium]
MYNQTVPDASLIACPDCDLLQRRPELAPGESARCPRCNEELRRRQPDSLHKPLALTITAALLYLIVNAVPILGLSVVGRHAYTTVIGGAEHLWNTGTPGLQIVAVLVFFTVVLAPGLQIGMMLAILLGAHRPHPRRWVGKLLRYYPTTATWSMFEVMILGVMVALIKIADYAQVLPGLGLYALGVLIFIIAAIESSFDPTAVWERVTWAGNAEARAQIAERQPQVRS